jgi:UDP-sugar transporter A1/2/3
MVAVVAMASVQLGTAFPPSVAPSPARTPLAQRPWVRGLRDHGDAAALLARLHHGLQYGLHSVSPSAGPEQAANHSAVTTPAAPGPAAALPSAKGAIGRGAVAALLLLLVLQNAGASLLTAAVRKTTPYDGASVALLQEIGKVPLIFAAFFFFRATGQRSGGAPSTESFRNVLRETFSKSALDLAFPSSCFAAQNVLYFTALRHLDAATYSLLSQSKTAFTAVFFCTVLGQRLAGLQVAALALLMAGMALVQLGPLWGAAACAPAAASATAASAAATSAAAASFAIGSLAVLASSFSSGLANIMFEKLVKFKGGSLYAKQLQLGLWTGAFTVAEIVRRHGVAGLAWPALTCDWTLGVWGIVFLKSVGGLLVAATIR